MALLGQLGDVVEVGMVVCGRQSTFVGNVNRGRRRIFVRLNMWPFLFVGGRNGSVIFKPTAYLHYKWTTNADKPPLANVCVESSPLCTSTSNGYGTEKRRKMEDTKECAEKRAIWWGRHTPQRSLWERQAQNRGEEGLRGANNPVVARNTERWTRRSVRRRDPFLVQDILETNPIFVYRGL
ncbi:putative FIP [Sesbania bispinosa]|nr:putative FIP [Sesbania bispinosa]